MPIPLRGISFQLVAKRVEHRLACWVQSEAMRSSSSLTGKDAYPTTWDKLPACREVRGTSAGVRRAERGNALQQFLDRQGCLSHCVLNASPLSQVSRQIVEFKCADPLYSSCKMNPYQTVLTLAVVKRALDDRLLASIDLSEFRAIDDDAADYLAAKCNHRVLKLNGIENLTDRAASSLSKVGADLHLDGIKSLSASAAASLAKHKKMLRLAGLKHLSVEAAEYLAYHDGTLEICIDYLPQASVDVFYQADEARASRQSNHHDQNLMHKPMGLAAILGAFLGGGLCLMLQIQNGVGGTLWIGGLVLGAALGHLLDSTSSRGKR